MGRLLTSRTRLELLESEMPRLVKNIDMCKPGLVWQADVPNYSPTTAELQMLFYAVNDGMFDNKIDGSVIEKSVVVRTVSDPRQARPMAAFYGGYANGQKKELMVFNDNGQKINYFHFVCHVIHEMIHAYDYEHGPIKSLLDRYGLISQLNWGRHSPDANPVKQTLQAGLMPDMLPDGMPVDGFPRQYMFPPFDSSNPHTARRFQKYRLSDTSMYDVHGGFFKHQAQKANDAGFDVDEVWYMNRPHRMRKVFEERDEDPVEDRYILDPNPVKRMYDSLKSDDLISYTYKDPENWFIAIA